MNLDNEEKNDTVEEYSNTKHQDSKKKEIFNLHSLLNLKKYESNLFRCFVVMSKSKSVNLGLFFALVETIQIFSVFYNEYYMPNLPRPIQMLFNIVTFKNLVDPLIPLNTISGCIILVYALFVIQFIMVYYSSRKFPNWLITINAFLIEISQNLLLFPAFFVFFDFFDCSKDPNDTNAKYICFNTKHSYIILGSLISCFFYVSYAYLVTVYKETYIPLTSSSDAVFSPKTIILFRRVIAIQFFNMYFVRVYLNLPLISSIIMFLGWVFILYHHFNHQVFYSQSLCSLYSGNWISLALTSFVRIFFDLFNVKPINGVFFGLTFVGFIAGIFIEKAYVNWYTNKIYSRIIKKYNQQHVISRLKEQLEMEHVNDDDRRSFDTIVTEKRVIKKEKVFNRPTDCAYVSRFIMKNRSIEAFNLVNCIFKEGLNQFERDPDFYLQFWNYLHGMRRFISINKTCFLGTEKDEFLTKINYLSDKVLIKCAKLSNTFLRKYLIYNAIFIYDMDKALLDESDGTGSNKGNNYELAELRETSIQYHIAALNSLKNLMSSLRTLDNPSDIDNAMKMNDDLTKILNDGESIYKKFIKEFNFSKESLELYVLFLRNSMNRDDLAEQYIQILDENEDTGDVEEKHPTKYNSGNDKSEKASSKASDMDSKKNRILKKNMLNRCQQPLYRLLNVIQILTVIAILIGVVGNIVYMVSFTKVINNLSLYTIASQAPSIMSLIKNSIRDISLLAAGGLPPMGYMPYTILTSTLTFLEMAYIPQLYHYHSISSSGINSVHPIGTGIIDEIKDVNYYKTMMKIERKASKILSKLNTTSILDPSFMYDRDVRFFTANLKGQFGKLFLGSVDSCALDINKTINRHEAIFFVLLGLIVVFIGLIIVLIIIPNSNKSEKFIKDIVCLYKTLPGKFFHEQSNEYMDQIKEICENYEVEDRGICKNNNKKKHSSTSSLKKSFIIYCFIVAVFLLTPFIVVFNYSTECKNLITFLAASTKRAYYINYMNHLCEEVIIKDRYFYSEGEELGLLNEYYNKLQTLESELKSGKYGGQKASDYNIFDNLNNNPGCVRGEHVQYQCGLRRFNEIYTEELANSPLDYQMVEYLNRMKDYINNIPDKNYDLKNQMSIKMLNIELLSNVNINLFKNLANDISGHITYMNEKGDAYLLKESTIYVDITLIAHGVCTVLIFITFFIFVTKPIKQQLRVVDSLTNITFSIPSSIYNSSPKLKNFIENGRLE